jgi:hypothetical protein
MRQQLRSSRRLVKMWHRREKVTIDRVVGELREKKGAAGTTHSAFTASGLAVEEQVRKVYRPSAFGLATF